MARAPKKRISSRRKSTASRRRKASGTSKAKPVARAAARSNARPRKSPKAAQGVSCAYCERPLTDKDRAIFVEEEVGRMFCSDNCIVAYFSKDIEKLESDFFRRVLPGDLTPREKDSLAELKWSTLEQPQESFVEALPSGDRRYTLIARYDVQGTPVWCVCLCLFLRGEPSFLYMSFLTKHEATVDAYRTGTAVSKGGASGTSDERDGFSKKVDRLAEAWTEDETNQAQLVELRRKDDIPPEQFRLYDGCIDETLQTPDEVWTLKGKAPQSLDVYHFIRQYPDLSPVVWYVIVARETDDREQIEILDAFPSKDPALVDRYRKGKQEIGAQGTSTDVSRLVH